LGFAFSAGRRGIVVAAKIKRGFKLRQERNMPPRRGWGMRQAIIKTALVDSTEGGETFCLRLPQRNTARFAGNQIKENIMAGPTNRIKGSIFAMPKAPSPCGTVSAIQIITLPMAIIAQTTNVIT